MSRLNINYITIINGSNYYNCRRIRYIHMFLIGNGLTINNPNIITLAVL